jgi:hypothetical protein
MNQPAIPKVRRTEPYIEQTQSAYAALAISTFIATELQGVMILSGICPRCEASMEFPVSDRIIRGGPIDEASPAAVEPTTVFCTCEEPHEGRPDGKVGCGAYWAFELGADG